MKKTIGDAAMLQQMQSRIWTMRADSPAAWGKMTAPQAMCHLADQLRMALGIIQTAGKPSFFGKYVMKNLVLMGMPAPKGKVSTLPEIDQAVAGTKPTDFESDRKLLLDLISTFLAKDESYVFQAHAFFGPMRKQQWAKLIWTHLDHHLKQFGV